MLKKLQKPMSDVSNVISKMKWATQSVPPTETQRTESGIKINLSDLGYADSKGVFNIEYVSNIGDQPSGSDIVDCTKKNMIVTSTELKATSPNAFFCRESLITIKYDPQASDTSAAAAPVTQTKQIEVNDTPTGVQKAPPIDEMKNIVMKTLSECYYFKTLEEESPIQFSSLKDKLKYFHPSFHSMTPEGLNARLTFLLQCLRPGSTLPIKGISDNSDVNARNTTFGPPPICVMRIGDFYHSKVVIKDVNIDYQDNIWDLNPEGIGVQPMIANVTLQLNFIGGHGLETPVAKLQNALSSNFFANTEVYDPRSTATEDMSKFEKSFLEQLLTDSRTKTNPTSQDAPSTTPNVTQGTYIGTPFTDELGNGLAYTDLLNSLFTKVSTYFGSFIDRYNSTISDYGTKLGSMIISPTYRTIKNYTVQIGSGTDTVELLGSYPKGAELDVLASVFKIKILDKISNTNISTIFGFGKDLSDPLMKKSEELLKPYVSTTIGTIIDGIPNTCINDVEKNRNIIIAILDKLNFMVETDGHDGSLSGTTAQGVDLESFTYDKLYGVYSDLISYMQDKASEFTEDLDTSFVFSRNTIMTADDLSYFLSVLLYPHKQDILNLYSDKTIFTDRITKQMGKRLDKFLVTPPDDKQFSKDFPTKKDDNPISFNVTDYSHTFTTDQITELTNVNRTSSNKTTTVLNYYR